MFREILYKLNYTNWEVHNAHWIEQYDCQKKMGTNISTQVKLLRTSVINYRTRDVKITSSGTFGAAAPT